MITLSCANDAAGKASSRRDRPDHPRGRVPTLVHPPYPLKLEVRDQCHACLSKIMFVFAGTFRYLCLRYWSTVPNSMRIGFFVILSLVPAIQAQTLAGCRVFPANNIWNTRITYLPVDPNSDNYVSRIGPTSPGHADFGSGLYDGEPIGIPYVAVPGSQPAVPVSFTYADESDPGPYPIPANAPIEGGSQSTGDRHVLVVDQGNCLLYEMFSSYPQTDGSWTAGSGAIFNLNSNALRPASWTSADAAGLPILPGLVKYDEVAAGAILHAVRFTAPSTQKAYIWPARHYASSITDTTYPPMGARFRLKASFNISTFSPDVQVILTALKTYGMILADNGSAWFISGVPDSRWSNDDLHQLSTLVGTDFEAVDESSLMLNANSGQAAVQSKPGIFRSGFLWLLDADGNHAWDSPPDLAYAYGGIAGDIPITGDWSGTGQTYRPDRGHRPAVWAREASEVGYGWSCRRVACMSSRACVGRVPASSSPAFCAHRAVPCSRRCPVSGAGCGTGTPVACHTAFAIAAIGVLEHVRHGVQDVADEDHRRLRVPRRHAAARACRDRAPRRAGTRQHLARTMTVRSGRRLRQQDDLAENVALRESPVGVLDPVERERRRDGQFQSARLIRPASSASTLAVDAAALPSALTPYRATASKLTIVSMRTAPRRVRGPAARSPPRTCR